MKFFKYIIVSIVLMILSYRCHDAIVTEGTPISSPNIKFSKSSLLFNDSLLTTSLIIENNENELVKWEIVEVPSWLILTNSFNDFSQFGEMETNGIHIFQLYVKPRGVKVGNYLDSLKIKFNDKLIAIKCNLELSCTLIPNGVFKGPTSNGGQLTLTFNNHILGCCEGEYFKMKADTINYTYNNINCFYSPMKYSDTCWFYQTKNNPMSGYYWSISGQFDGDSTISGYWIHEYGSTEYVVKME